jgi:hypothetical protein
MAFPPCCIYGLVDPRTGAIRYIGKTVRGITRVRAHGQRMHEEHTHKSAWLKQLRAAGLRYKVLVLEELPAEELCAAEVRWIALARKIGWALTNLTDGGDGAHGCRQSTETRKKRAMVLRGQKRTPEQRARYSAAFKGVKKSDAHRAAITAASRARAATETFRLEVSRRNSRAVIDLDTGARYASVKLAAQLAGVGQRTISRSLHGASTQRHFAYG